MAEETIKQELQDVAEGVVASVLQSATSSELGLSGNEGALGAMPEEQVEKIDLDPQSEDNPEVLYFYIFQMVLITPLPFLCLFMISFVSLHLFH